MELMTIRPTRREIASLLIAVAAVVGACRPCPEQIPATTEPVTTEAAAPSGERGPPLIGITGYVIEPGSTPDDSNGSFRMTRTYRDAVIGAGGQPVHLVPVPSEDVPELLEHLDGLVLAGGPDIDPSLYHEEQHPTVELMPTERQEFDLALVREAIRRRMPVLGICLGSQEINVALGGTMVQDIPSEVEGAVGHRQVGPEQSHRGVHEVTFVEGTLLAQLYEQPTISVNSLHHQASDELGEGLVVAARAPDGVIEGFVMPSVPFLVGVQYHPEMQDDPPGIHERLLHAFIEAATTYQGQGAE